MKKVTVIIPNYNGKEFLEECLNSLQKQNFQDFDILIVDNGSEDDSVAFLEKEYPEVRLLGMDQNYGFSFAVNAGIRASETPYVLLLNNDTKADPDFVGEMVKTIERSDMIFSVASKMVQMYHPELLDSAGDCYTLMGWALNRGVGRPVRNYRMRCNVFSACAGAAIYRRELFEEIGYFDVKHFAYLEDIDVCYRALIYGYQNQYCPKAIVYHVGSGTSGSKYNSFKVRLAARNGIYVNYKNQPFLQLLINAPLLALGILIKGIFFYKRGFGKDYLKGLKEGFTTLHKLDKVAYESSRFGNYIRIELAMLRDTFTYTFDWLTRKVLKR